MMVDVMFVILESRLSCILIFYNIPRFVNVRSVFYILCESH